MLARFVKSAFQRYVLLKETTTVKNEPLLKSSLNFQVLRRINLKFRKCQGYVIRTGRYERNFVTENKNHYLHLYGTSFLLCNNFHEILTFFSDAL